MCAAVVNRVNHRRGRVSSINISQALCSSTNVNGKFRSDLADVEEICERNIARVFVRINDKSFSTVNIADNTDSRHNEIASDLFSFTICPGDHECIATDLQATDAFGADKCAVAFCCCVIDCVGVTAADVSNGLILIFREELTICQGDSRRARYADIVAANRRIALSYIDLESIIAIVRGNHERCGRSVSHRRYRGIAEHVILICKFYVDAGNRNGDAGIEVRQCRKSTAAVVRCIDVLRGDTNRIDKGNLSRVRGGVISISVNGNLGILQSINNRAAVSEVKIRLVGRQAIYCNVALHLTRFVSNQADAEEDSTARRAVFGVFEQTDSRHLVSAGSSNIAADREGIARVEAADCSQTGCRIACNHTDSVADTVFNFRIASGESNCLISCGIEQEFTGINGDCIADSDCCVAERIVCSHIKAFAVDRVGDTGFTTCRHNETVGCNAADYRRTCKRNSAVRKCNSRIAIVCSSVHRLNRVAVNNCQSGATTDSQATAVDNFFRDGEQLRIATAPINNGEFGSVTRYADAVESDDRICVFVLSISMRQSSEIANNSGSSSAFFCNANERNRLAGVTVVVNQRNAGVATLQNNRAIFDSTSNSRVGADFSNARRAAAYRIDSPDHSGISIYQRLVRNIDEVTVDVELSELTFCSTFNRGARRNAGEGRVVDNDAVKVFVAFAGADNNSRTFIEVANLYNLVVVVDVEGDAVAKCVVITFFSFCRCFGAALVHGEGAVHKRKRSIVESSAAVGGGSDSNSRIG